MKSHSLATAALLGLSIATYAQAPKITYTDHILPLFRNSCTNCHNPDKKKAGLDLTTYQDAMAGGESGPAIKPGNGDGSLMYKLAAHLDEPKMPPKGDKLSDADLKLLKDWINGFALENANSKPATVAANKVDVAVVSLTKPDGPPPMPGDLPLEPFGRAAHDGTAVMAMAASPWAPLVAIGGQKQIFLYHTETNEPLGVLAFPEGYANVLKFSRNAKLLLAAGGLGGKLGKVVLWDVTTGERAGVVGNESDAILAADISPDHQFVALGGPEKRVKIYRTKDNKQTALIKKHTEWITAIAYSPDGKYLATADRNGGVEVWEAGAEPKPFNTLAGHKASCTGLAFMPGVLASCSEDGKVTLWNVKEGTEIKSWTAHAGGVEWVEFSPDGRIATCGRDKVAKIWDQTGKLLATTEAFNDLATRCTISNDRVIAADWTGEIRVCGMDGKRLGALSANPPGIAEQLAATEKTLSETSAALPALQKAVTDAEAKVKAEKEAAEAKLKADIAAAEARKADTVKSLEAAKTAPGLAEKAVNDLTAQATVARDAVTKAESALAEKKKAPAAAPAPAADPAKAAAEVAAAKKHFDELTAEIAKRREARAKFAEGTPEYTKADAPVQAIKPDLAKAEAALAAAQTKGSAPAPTPTVAAPNPAEIEAAKAALANAQKQSETARQNLQQAQQTLAKARAAAPKNVADLEKAVAAADAEINKLKNPAAATAPASAPAPKPTVDAAKIAEMEQRMEKLTAGLVKMREKRATFGEGTPEYEKANAAVQARKTEIAQFEETLAKAKGQAAPAAAAPAAPKGTEAEQALAKAKADLDAANSRLTLSKTGVERWKRAQMYQTVFNARQSVSDKQAKYDDLLATAKDAFRQAELAKQGAADAEKLIADSPKLLAEKEAAHAEVKKIEEAAAAALAAADKAVADKKNELPDKPKIEAEIADLDKQVAALNAEREKLREERGKFAQGTPEFTALQGKRDALRNKLTPLETALNNARAKLAGGGPVPPEMLEAVKKAQLDHKLAHDKLAAADKTLADAKKSIEDAKKQLPELKARIPQLQADGVKIKADAEKSAATLAKELQSAKADAERLRAQFDASKKSATAAPAPAATLVKSDSPAK